MNWPSVYILILNWNGWENTIECLETVLCSDYRNFQIIVCDNGSTDNSLERIKEWAEGRLAAPSPTNGTLHRLFSRLSTKPVQYTEYSLNESEQGGASEAKLTLIQNGANLGFAGGNNVGLRYALARGDFEYVWLLNNDTVIKSDSLTHLVKRLKSSPGAGICGSTLLYYDAPDTIQGLGGATYNKWFGTTKPLGFLKKYIPPVAQDAVEKRMRYVIGASMLVTKEFLEEVGLMTEDYFLFFEELDWAIRARDRFRFVYAAESIVYHKEGRSAGIHNDPKKKSAIADYYLARNKLLIARKFFPFTLPTVYLGLFITVFNRIRRGQMERVKMILDIIFHGGKEIS